MEASYSRKIALAYGSKLSPLNPKCFFDVFAGRCRIVLNAIFACPAAGQLNDDVMLGFYRPFHSLETELENCGGDRWRGATSVARDRNYA